MTPAAELLAVAEGIPAAAGLIAYGMWLRSWRPSAPATGPGTAAPAAIEQAPGADLPGPRLLPAKLPGLTTSQVHELTGWSSTTIKRWSDDGTLNPRRDHLGHRRFDEAEVRAAMNGGTAS